MGDFAQKNFGFKLSEEVASRLQKFVNATGLDAALVVDRSLEIFFESEPEELLVQKISQLDAVKNAQSN